MVTPPCFSASNHTAPNPFRQGVFGAGMFYRTFYYNQKELTRLVRAAADRPLLLRPPQGKPSTLRGEGAPEGGG